MEIEAQRESANSEEVKDEQVLPEHSSDKEEEGLRLDSSATPPKRKRRKPKKLLSGEVEFGPEGDVEMKDEATTKPKKKKPRKPKQVSKDVLQPLEQNKDDCGSKKSSTGLNLYFKPKVEQVAAE